MLSNFYENNVTHVKTGYKLQAFKWPYISYKITIFLKMPYNPYIFA